MMIVATVLPMQATLYRKTQHKCQVPAERPSNNTKVSSHMTHQTYHCVALPPIYCSSPCRSMRRNPNGRAPSTISRLHQKSTDPHSVPDGGDRPGPSSWGGVHDSSLSRETCMQITRTGRGNGCRRTSVLSMDPATGLCPRLWNLNLPLPLPTRRIRDSHQSGRVRLGALGLRPGMQDFGSKGEA